MKTNRTPRSSRCGAALHIGAFIAFAGPAAAFSQSTPCPVASDYTVPSGGMYTLSASPCFVLSGVRLTSNGDLFNETPANHAGTIVNDGTLVNNHDLWNAVPSGDGGTITNFGTLINNGRIFSPLGAATGTVTNAGILVNVGEVSANLNNAGSLTSTGSMGIEQGVNSVGASIYNYGDLGISGPLTNQGTFESFGPAGSVTLRGTLTNAGTLTNDTGSTMSVTLGSLENSAGATFTNRGILSNSAEVDNSGTAIITGVVNNKSGFFVNLAGGMMTLQSGGDFTNDAGATLDNFGTVSNSGIVQTAGTLVNGAGAAINISLGALFVTGTLINEGSINNNIGEVLIESGGVLTNLTGSTFVQGGGRTTLNGNASTLDSVPTVQIEAGPFSGDGTINGSLDNGGGVVQPASEEGGTDVLTVNGNYTQGVGGELQIVLGGDAPGDFGVLDVSGLASLDGRLDLFGIGFTPQAGDDLTFLLFGDLAGDFQNIDFDNWTCPMDDTCSVITGVHSMSLDITANDGGGGGTTVPEPSALSLLTVGLAGLFCTRVIRRRRSALPRRVSRMASA